MIIHSFGLVKKFIWVFHNIYGKSRTKCLANPVLNTVGNKIYWFSFSRDFMVHMRDNLHVTEINHCEKHRKGRLALFGERNQRRPPWEPPWFHENGASLIPWERGMERSREGKGHVEKPFLWLLPLRARLTQALLRVHSVFTILPCPCHLLFFGLDS